jgi:flagellar protein FlgJ
MASDIGPATGSSGAYEKLRQQAVELEGVFLNTLMKEMFSSLKTDTADFGGGFAEETWRGMQAEQFAGAMADAGGIGLAEALLPDLLALQENAQSSQIPPLAGAYR